MVPARHEGPSDTEVTAALELMDEIPKQAILARHADGGVPSPLKAPTVLDVSIHDLEFILRGAMFKLHERAFLTP